jgi:tetratricopeptide (TPR) repeat protein
LNAKKMCLIVLVSVSACVAQSFHPLRGQVSGEAQTDLSFLTVRLDVAGSHDRGATTMVSAGGDFMFLNVADGQYVLRLLNTAGDEIMSESVTVSSASPPISLQLPHSAAERPTGETTSVARLRHRPNRRALSAAGKAQKFSESGAYARSAAEWQKAVEADPDFSEAHGNLGAQYARLNRFNEAADEFRKAIALDPSTARHQSNLAVALAQTGHLDEAESWARSAVRMEESALSHYVLGCVLTARPAKVVEGIEQLRIAARQIPKAHMVLAKLYFAQGKDQLALAETKQFEEASQGGERRTESWSSPLR